MKICINNYEHITFENINQLQEKDKENIIKLYNIFPLVKDIDLLNSLNKLNKIQKKNILIVKIISQNDIYNEKLILRADNSFNKNNNIKTLFIFKHLGPQMNTGPQIYDIDSYVKEYKIFNINEINSKEFNKYIKNTDIFYLSSDNISEIIFLNIINCGLKNININGDIIIDNIYPYSFIYIQLFYILFNNFTKLTYYKYRFTYNKTGVFIFKKLLNSKILDLDNIIKKNEKNKQNEIKPKSEELNIIINNEIPDNFINYLNKIYNLIEKKSKKLNVRILYILKKLNSPNTQIINEIITENLHFALNKCLKNNLEITDYYKLLELKSLKSLKTLKSLPTYIKILNSIFDDTLFDKNKIKNIKLIIDNNISLLKSNTIKKLINKIKNNFININNIIDINPSFGLFTLYFSQHFTDVICINNNNILLENLKLFNFKNISIINFNIYNLYIEKYLSNNNYCIFLDITSNFTSNFTSISTSISNSNSNSINENYLDFILNKSINNICLKVNYNFNIHDYSLNNNKNIIENIIDNNKFIFINTKQK